IRLSRQEADAAVKPPATPAAERSSPYARDKLRRLRQTPPPIRRYIEEAAADHAAPQRGAMASGRPRHAAAEDRRSLPPRSWTAGNGAALVWRVRHSDAGLHLRSGRRGHAPGPHLLHP